MDLGKTRLQINGFTIFDAGEPVVFDAKQVSHSMQSNFETQVSLVVGTGDGKAQHWTSDLTVNYVRFNSEYTT